jgi:hypothetical protein
MPTEEDKIKYDKEASDSINMSEEKLLSSIFESADRGIQINPPVKIARMLSHFSALLIKLSLKTEEATNKTIKLTKQLYYLTWFIAILTAILLFVGLFQIFQKSVVAPLNPHQKNEQTQKNNNPDQQEKVINGIVIHK